MRIFLHAHVLCDGMLLSVYGQDKNGWMELFTYALITMLH